MPVPLAGDIGFLVHSQQPAHRHVECVCNPGEAACANTVDALLVLLNLLKSHAQRLGKRRLREADIIAQHADSLSDCGVDGVRRLGTHIRFLPRVMKQQNHAIREADCELCTAIVSPPRRLGSGRFRPALQRLLPPC